MTPGRTNRKYLSLDSELKAKQLAFGSTMRCTYTAELAGLMELAAKIPGISTAGRWQLLVTGLKKRALAFTKQKLTPEAAALADFRRRKEEATAPHRAGTSQGPAAHDLAIAAAVGKVSERTTAVAATEAALAAHHLSRRPGGARAALQLRRPCCGRCRGQWRHST